MRRFKFYWAPLNAAVQQSKYQALYSGRFNRLALDFTIFFLFS